jgi:hypothetical protein
MVGKRRPLSRVIRPDSGPHGLFADHNRISLLQGTLDLLILPTLLLGPQLGYGVMAQKRSLGEQS